MLPLVKGILTGILISIPTGPVGFLCVKRTIADGFFAGILSGVGSVLADFLYAIVVLLGLHGVTHFVEVHAMSIRTIGGLLLLAVGWRTYHDQKFHEKTENSVTVIENISSTFFITLTNPTQLITFSIVFASVGALSGGRHAVYFFLGGLLIGAFMWWFSIAFLMDRFRHKLSDKIFKYISMFAGVLIMGTGLLALLSVAVW